MINHVSIGVRDLTRTKRFYEAALRIVCDEIIGGCSIEELVDHVKAAA